MECAEFLWAAQFLHWPIPYLGLYCRPRRGPAANRLQGETAGKNRTRSSAIFNFKIQYLQINCKKTNFDYMIISLLFISKTFFKPTNC